MPSKMWCVAVALSLFCVGTSHAQIVKGVMGIKGAEMS
jgi:hypothetical protein